MIYKDFLHQNTIDVLSPETLADYELFFGPIEEGQKPFITTNKNIGEVLHALNLCESKSWARKNNWWKPIPPGFHMVEFGKGKIQLYFLVEYK